MWIDTEVYMLFSTYYRNVNPRNNVFIGCKLWKHFDKMSYCWHSNMMIWVEMGQYCFIWVNMALCYFVPFSWFLGRISVEYRGVCLGEKQGWFYFFYFFFWKTSKIYFQESTGEFYVYLYIFFQANCTFTFLRCLKSVSQLSDGHA